MNQLIDIFRGLDWSVLTDMVLSVIPALICITVHEFCHGLSAYMLGDNTAKNMGRLTLNPLRHLDVMGLLMMAVFKFGWAKPVPVNPRNFKDEKRGMVITALAGPLSNIVLAALMMVLYGILWRVFGPRTYIPFETILTTAYLSTALAIFNLLPIPPLDGSKVFFGLLLSDDRYSDLLRYEQYGKVLLLLLVWRGVINRPLSAATAFVFEKLTRIALLFMRG